MSLLLHLCRECGHKESSHDGRDRGYSGCSCCRGRGDIAADPVLVRTFTLAGAPEPLHLPGTVWNAGTMHQQQLCGCGHCRAVARGCTDDPVAGTVQGTDQPDRESAHEEQPQALSG